MADFRRGIKAGVVAGIIYMVIPAVLGAIYSNSFYVPHFLNFLYGAGLTPLFSLAALTDPLSVTSFLFQYVVRGIVFGAVFAALYSFLPSTGSIKSIKKGLVLSAFIWVLSAVGFIYITPGWPTDGGSFWTYCGGGAVVLSSVGPALAGIISALAFGALTGFLWDRFQGKRVAEAKKGSSVLLLSFILGGVTWAYFAALFLAGVIIGGGPPIQPEFWWSDLLYTLVVFLGLPGFVLADVAWRKTRVDKSGFRWGVVGGVLMALTGIMLLPGVLAIIGGVFNRREATRELSTAEVIAGGKVAREQRTRTGIRRNLILLIISAVVLAVIIIARFTIPTPSGTYTPVTLDQYSSTTISRYGLSLAISLNSTTYHPGEQISVNIEEKNILPTENEVRAANRWPFHGLTLTPCGTLYYPFGISILQGYYDSENIAGVTPLQLFDPNVAYTCPAILAAVSYDFQPWSDSATIYTGYGLMPWSRNMSTEVTSEGFWTVTHGHPTWTFSNFTPGMYTVVGGDEWGTLVILHFTVS